MKPRKKKEAPQSVQGSSWTNGRAKSTAAVTFLMVGAILCGPAALVVAMNATPPARAVVADAPDELSVDEQAAGSYALSFVGAWLRATRDDPGVLGEYTSVSALRLAAVPWEYRDAAVASIERAQEGVVTVTISAAVQQVAYDSDGSEVASWPLRFFRVGIATTGETFSPLTLPAPVNGATRATDLLLAYPVNGSTTDSLAGTVGDFLNAYLAGIGELDRFVSPGADIAPVEPALFAQTTLTSLSLDTQPSDAPDEGDTVRALATAELIGTDGRALTGTYSFTLTARAGRWEIESIDQSPAIDTSNTATPTPTPAGTGLNQ